MLLSRIADTIRRHGMFQPGQSIGVAVSGGADSVCLLHLLQELALAWNCGLTVLHLNHGLRGAESGQDELFVRELAARLELPVIVRSADVAASGDNLEQAARDARLSFFREQMATGALARVAVGHTRNDQAETVLFRILRGTGGAGLAAIRPVTADGFVRPLLEVERGDVERYLRHRGITWREDSSNASPQFARNRIRHQLLPQLARDWNPAITEALSRTADWALAEEEYWDAETSRLAEVYLVERPGAILLRTTALRELPLAAARRLVRRALEQVRGDLRGVDFHHVATILELAQTEAGYGRTQLPGTEVTRSFDWLRFANPGPPEPDFAIAAPVPGSVQLPGTGILLSLELVEKAETIRGPESVYNSETALVDWRSLSGALQIRNWRPGDRYQPCGSAGEEKIKNLFQKARIPRWERCQWPVMTDGSSIVWTRQFGAALAFAANAGCMKVVSIREVQVL